jgi:16S rRNA (cytidine1402-2'-O)-methyltransferase
MFYLVGTPLGNVKDISLRAVETLTKVDVILCEDTRTFSVFYKKIQDIFKKRPIKRQKLVSYYQEKEFEKLSLILNFLKENKEIALVSESGMPAISDPGNILINQLIKMKIPYSVIPGPSAFINALVLSGYQADRILFLGFLPKKPSHLFQLINKLKEITKTLKGLTVVFYESPHRINKTLVVINQLIPQADICICREMTKKFEEVIKGKPAKLTNKKFKGEITVAIKL